MLLRRSSRPECTISLDSASRLPAVSSGPFLVFSVIFLTTSEVPGVFVTLFSLRRYEWISPRDFLFGKELFSDIFCNYCCHLAGHGRSLYPGPFIWQRDYFRVVSTYNFDLLSRASVSFNTQALFAEYSSRHTRLVRRPEETFSAGLK